MRKYLAWAMAEQTVNIEDCGTVRRVLDQYEASILTELDGLDSRLRMLRTHPGIEVFPLRDESWFEP